MPPIRYAMSLINDKQRNVPRKQRQNIVHKFRICKPFRGNQENINRTALQSFGNIGPLMLV